MLYTFTKLTTCVQDCVSVGWLGVGQYIEHEPGTVVHSAPCLS